MELFPKIEPWQAGKIPVEQAHEIYFEQCGNPDGVPLLHLHGGPGSGHEEMDRQFYNPDKWRIIIFDQRGAGKSRPLGEITCNDTDRLVADIDHLCEVLKTPRVVLSAGSWGSALALIYAIRRPYAFSGMILRGVFLANEDARIVTHGGTAKWYPEAWARFISNVPFGEQHQAYRYYWQKILAGTPEEKRRFAFELNFYAGSISSLFPKNPTILEEEIQKDMADTIASSLIEGHYALNDFFIPPHYILTNAKTIGPVPITLIQGRFDALCPLSSVIELAKQLPAATKLRIITSGHSKKDPEMQTAILEEVEALYEQVKHSR